MIASDKKAIRVGRGALLVVDGTDATLERKAQFSLVAPGRVATKRLSTLLALSAEVYNAAIEHRRGAWRTARVSVSAFDQFNEIPEMRTARPDVAAFGNQFVRGSISRADEAFAAFFRRVRNGETPGYPRFKSAKRFRTVCYDEPSTWVLRGLVDKDSDETSRPALFLKGVGELVLGRSAVKQLRRLLERGGEPRTLTITRAPSGAWSATVGFRGVTSRPLEPSRRVGGVDRGITVTAALSDGTLLTMPGFLRDARDEIANLQRRREQHRKFGPEWRKLNRRIAKTYKRAHNQSENWARHAAIEIVARYGVIAIERLNLVNMTKSAKGTLNKPGKGESAKAGLNRSLQDAALGRLAHWICVRAEEAGRIVYKVDPRDTSRTCIACGHIDAANRSGTRFHCRRCGHQDHADVNAARVIATRGMAAHRAWQANESPLLERPVAKKLRHKSAEPAVVAAASEDSATPQGGAGPAPHADAA